MIGKIQRVPIKTIWENEAFDFTPWLRDNIDVLNDITEFNLSSAESEQRAGTFSIDIVAEDESGNPIIVENQFGKSDHGHLGKLLTYFSFVEAKGGIWIVEDPRPEHIKAISLLNEISPSPFYIIKVEAIKIGESLPAPLFTVIVGPSEESKDVGIIKKDIAERYKIRFEFWKELLGKSNRKTKLHSNISPNKYSWLGTSAGKRGLGFNYGIRQHSAQIELYIDKGSGAKEENEKIFDSIFENKEAIEEKFGSDLLWQKLENKQACRICKKFEIGGYKDSDKWDDIHNTLIDAMIKFAKSLKPFIKKIDV